MSIRRVATLSFLVPKRQSEGHKTMLSAVKDVTATDSSQRGQTCESRKSNRSDAAVPNPS